MAGEQVAQLFLGDLRPARARIPTEQPDDHVGRPGEQPDDRPHQAGEPVQRWRHCRRHAFSALQREPLRCQLPQDERQIDDRQRDDDQRERFGKLSRHAPADQRRGDVVGQRRGAERRGEEPGRGDTDLDRREEPVGVTSQLCDTFAAAAALGDLSELALPQRDQGDLRRREDAADEDEQQDQPDIRQCLVHRRARPRGPGGALRQGWSTQTI